jgi:circadian clock protein KaiC
MTEATRHDGEALPFERMATGVPGLDDILRGGLVRGATYLVMGRPGTGKTTLGNQLCFARVAQGGRAAYVTLLSESHVSMLRNLQTMRFFDERSIDNGLSYVGAYKALREGKLRGLLEVVGRVMHDEKTSLLVIDGAAPARMHADNEVALKEFVVELQTLSGLLNCTTLLLANMTSEDASGAEHTMVDGLIELAFERARRRTLRTLEVLKFRGAEHLLGRHEMTISAEGIGIHPRLEDLQDGARRPAPAFNTRATTGIPGLDSMLLGGLSTATTTVVLGYAGSGKTTLGMHFLQEGAALGEPGVLFGFYESPDRLLQAADGMGLRLRAFGKEGLFSHVWQPSYEFGLDVLGERLLGEIERRKARRVVIDSLDGFRQATTDPERTLRFMTALLNELRARGVTILLTDETLKPSGPEMEMRIQGISALVENLILLEYLMVSTTLRRLVAVIKQRGSQQAAFTREFALTSQGMVVAPDAKSAEELIERAEDLHARRSRKPSPPEGE